MNKFRELLFLKSIKGYGNSKIIHYYLSELSSVEGIDDCVEMVKRLDSSVSEAKIESAKARSQEIYDKVVDDPSIHVTTLFDDDYPSRLNDMKHRRPVFLYARGNIELLNSDTISVVGTRHPSELSEISEKRIVQKVLDSTQRTIVSGLALGCDRIAHEAALYFNAYTIAVLPSGINVITPAKNRPLAEEILTKNGCIVSEYEPNAKVNKSTYVERDAIIAALGDATLVVECAEDSGTMHTVRAAVDLRRKLACYCAKDETKGDYSGNRYMISEYESVPIRDSADLIPFLATLPRKTKQEEVSAEATT